MSRGTPKTVSQGTAVDQRTAEDDAVITPQRAVHRAALADGITVQLAVPDTWEVLVPPDPAVAWLAVEPVEGQAFRSSVVLTYDHLDATMDLPTWQNGVDEAFEAGFTDWYLLDLERCALDGRVAARRLATYTSTEGLSLTLEQWALLIGTLAISLTVTCDSPRYGEVASWAAGWTTELRILEGGRS